MSAAELEAVARYMTERFRAKDYMRVWLTRLRLGDGLRQGQVRQQYWFWLHALPALSALRLGFRDHQLAASCWILSEHGVRRDVPAQLNAVREIRAGFSQQPAAEPRTAVPHPRNDDWADIANIRAEWPESELNVDKDLRKWNQGLVLYSQGPDQPPASMLRCATLLSASLAHSLYGEGILRGQDLVETVYKTLRASLAALDQHEFPEAAQRIARLALTLVRENGWQPTSMGGDGLFDDLLTETYSDLMLPVAIGRQDGDPNTFFGDLEAFFAVPPQPLLPQLPDPEKERVDQVVRRMHVLLTHNHDDDDAAMCHKNGMILWASGEREDALAALGEAAELGSTQAMKDAGDLTKEMGREDESWFWYETAAKAGNADSMWNIAVRAYNIGDLSTAADWYQKAAVAGLADGYAALTQIARDHNDATAMRHWAKLGAEAGQTFCMVFHGMHLSMDANGDVPTLRRSREFLEQAATRGDVGAAGLAVRVNFQLGDQTRAHQFIKMVLESGDQDEIDRLRKYGYL